MKLKITALLGFVFSLSAPVQMLGAPARPAPTPIETPSPAYPPALADTGKAGRASIEIIIRTDGTVGSTKVVSSDDEAFAAAALEVLPRWRFEPVLREGEPVEARVIIPFHFTPPMQQQLNALFKRKVFQVMPEPALSQKEFGKKPKPLKPIQAVYPKSLARSGVEETVEVTFVIAPDGTTINPDITGKPRKELVIPALTAVANATFAPPVKNGKPVYVASSVKLKYAPPARPAKRGGGDFGDGGGFGGGGFGGGGRDFGGGGGSPD